MKKIVVLLLSLLSIDTVIQAQSWIELGTGSHALNPNADIYTTCLDRHGNVYAAGIFWDITDSAMIVAKWDGTSWRNLGPFVPASLVNQIQVLCSDTSGNIYAGGQFKNSSGKCFVAKWDGTFWSEVGIGSSALNASGGILSISFDKYGNMYAAGAFSDTTGHAYVAKWDGASWSAVGMGTSSLNANAAINSIFIDTANNIYAAGDFTDGATHDTGNLYVAKWNGVSWSELGSGVSSSNHGELGIWSVLGDLHGNIYASGSFYNSSGKYFVDRWDGASWSELGMGSSALNANDLINSMCFDTSGNLYAAGTFTDSVFGYGGQYVAKWDGASWSEVGTGINKLNANEGIMSICSDLAGNIYAGGLFKDATGHPYVAKYNNPAATSITPVDAATGVTVYPNPANNKLNINITESGNELIGADYALCDCTYRMFNKGKIEHPSTEINISQIPPGTYLLQLGNTFVYRVVKE